MTDDANQIPVTTAAPPAEDPPASSTGAPSALPEGKLAQLTDDIIAALETVYDPEIPSDIYELGLIYKIDIADDRAVEIEMTLTTPNCPSAQELPTMVENAVASVPGVGEVKVNIVWDPPWDPSRMSDEAPRCPQHVVRREARPRARDLSLRSVMHCEGIFVLTPAFGLYFGTPVLSEEVFGALIVLHPRASTLNFSTPLLWFTLHTPTWVYKGK